MLLIKMLENMSLIVMAAYILSQSGIFKSIMKDKLNTPDKAVIILFFSVISIIGTYTGIGVQPYALANSRPVGVIVSGYIGGPLVGLVVGAIAGVHRYTLGGFTAFACGVASVIEGLIGGLFSKYSRSEKYGYLDSIMAGVIAETLQMVIILIFSRPLSDALNLVRQISPPMIIVNSIGVVVFIQIIKNAFEKEKRINAIQVQRALSIAKETTEYLRKGLDENAEKVADIIKESGNVKGVFLANSHRILTYRGVDIGSELLENEFNNYLQRPESKIIMYKYGDKNITLLCEPIIVSGGELQGVIGLLVDSKKNVDKYSVEFLKELSNLLATQIELFNLTKLAQAATTAQLKALRAQIHPHFLFNALNTISSLCRTNPLKARDLILNLSNYFRNTLRREEDFVQLSNEIELIESYLYIEKARFGERLKLFIDVPEELGTIRIPVFILQPLVENSIKHGISPKVDGGSVTVSVKLHQDEYIFSVKDTGVGMDRERYNEVINSSPGIGLSNISERLKLLYGENRKLNISSSFGEGTEVEFRIPVEGGMLNG